MALTEGQLAQLRKMIDETDDSDGWSDTALQLLASQYVLEDGSYNLPGAAGGGWAMKAARYVELVRVSESGSSRDLQQMFDHALAMAKYYDNGGGDGEEVVPVVVPPQSTKIVRAVRGA